MDAVVALFLDGGVPPAGQVDDVGRGRQRQPGPGRLGSEDQEVEGRLAREVTLEAVHDRLELRDRRVAGDHVDAGQPERGARELDEPVLHTAMLYEDKRPLAPRGDRAEDVEHSAEPR